MNDLCIELQKGSSANVKFEVSDTYNRELLLNIKHLFERNFKVMHKARNEIRVITYSGKKLVLKSFRIPSPVNRFAYSFIRDSKAKRSFDNALVLKSLETNTPEPVGYIEFFSGKMIKENFYVSAYSESDFTIRTVLLDKEIENRDEILKEFAEFTHGLHEKNIYHKDYSPGNILVKKVNSGWKFEIVDINRMRFGKISYKNRIKNFVKLWADDDTMRTIIREYASFSGDNPAKAERDALKWLHSYKARINFKKRLKKLMKRKKDAPLNV
jgi:hypothetical protein